MKSTTRAQAGFSLVELLVAMAITLVVSGAIYGLMTAGQGAFRREPELTERQQNIRIAMDLIARDIDGAGVGMPPFIQSFTQGLDACTTAPACAAPGSTMGESGQIADELEMISNTESGGNEPACDDPGSSLNARLVRVVPAAEIPIGTPVVLVFADGSWSMREVTNVSVNNSGSDRCVAGTDHTQLAFSSGQDVSGMNDTPGNNQVCQPNGLGVGNCDKTLNPSPDLSEIAFADVIRYRIRHLNGDTVCVPGSAPACLPTLQRFSTALLTADLLQPTPPANPGWRNLVRGIEDLQVQYGTIGGGAALVNGAPLVVNGTYNTLISRVQVTLWARATGPQANMAGLRTSGGAGPAALRGSLTSLFSPRMALVHMANQPTIPALPSPRPTPAWQ